MANFLNYLKKNLNPNPNCNPVTHTLTHNRTMVIPISGNSEVVPVQPHPNHIPICIRYNMCNRKVRPS